VERLNSMTSYPRLFIGIAASSGSSGQISQITLPLIVGATLVGLGLDEQGAGLLSSVELVTVALVAFAIAPKMGVWPRRRIALGGAGIAILAHAFSTMAPPLVPLVAARVMAGVGAGMMVAAGNACIANAENPDRLASLVIVWTGFIHLVTLNLMPIFVDQWSYVGAYGFEAAFIALMLPLMFLLPQHALDGGGRESHQDRFPLGAALAVVVIVGIFFARETALWAFSQQIGLRTGLTNQQVGTVLGLTGALGILGAVAAATIGTRYGRMKPMIAGLFMNAVLSFWISQTSDPVIFAVAEVVYHAALFFTVPYLFGMAAELDRHGRLVAMAGGSILLGGSLGPAIGGALISWQGYSAIGGFIIIAMTVVTMFAWRLQRRLEGKPESRWAWKRD
jgi:predicted MFS family arabinose efflux permease